MPSYGVKEVTQELVHLCGVDKVQQWGAELDDEALNLRLDALPLVNGHFVARSKPNVTTHPGVDGDVLRIRGRHRLLQGHSPNQLVGDSAVDAKVRGQLMTSGIVVYYASCTIGRSSGNTRRGVDLHRRTKQPVTHRFRVTEVRRALGILSSCTLAGAPPQSMLAKAKQAVHNVQKCVNSCALLNTRERCLTVVFLNDISASKSEKSIMKEHALHQHSPEIKSVGDALLGSNRNGATEIHDGARHTHPRRDTLTLPQVSGSFCDVLGAPVCYLHHGMSLRSCQEAVSAV